MALEALNGVLTIAEIAGKYQNHPNLVQQWKKKLQERAPEIFLTETERKSKKVPFGTVLAVQVPKKYRLTVMFWTVENTAKSVTFEHKNESYDIF